MNNLQLNMIINKKKAKKKSQLIREIQELIESHKVNINIEGLNCDTVLDTFLLSYMQLTKLMEIEKDDFENKIIVGDIIEDIITKVENNDFIIPKLNKKKINIQEKIENFYKSNSKINITLKH